MYYLIYLSIVCVGMCLNCSNKMASYDNLQVRSGVFYIMNTDKPFSGKIVEYNEDGAIVEAALIKKGRYVGERKWFLENGQILRSVNYGKGIQYGNIETHQFDPYDGSTLKYRLVLIGDTVFELYNSDNILKERAHFKGGIQESIYSDPEISYYNGKYEYFYNNGNINILATKIGQPGWDVSYVGAYQEYDSTGTLIKQCNYDKHGQLDGLYSEFYPNGKKRYEVNYKKNSIEGLKKTWYDNGNKKSERNYKDGRNVGYSKDWYYNGQIQKYNSAEGDTSNKWFENGKLQLEIIRLSKSKYWSDKYSYTNYWDNGNKKIKGFLYGGEPKGEFTFWSKDGVEKQTVSGSSINRLPY